VSEFLGRDWWERGWGNLKKREEGSRETYGGDVVGEMGWDRETLRVWEMIYIVLFVLSFGRGREVRLVTS
jgi:hypothetical protein